MESIQSFRQRARTWLSKSMEPAMEDASPHTGDEDRALQARLARGSFAGITLPLDFGGQGLTFEHQKAFYEEARGYDLPTGFVVSLAMLAPTLVDHASPELLREHLPRMIAGQEIWIQLLSEPGGGSDLAGAVTGATAMATRGSSTVRRSGAPGRPLQISACAWLAPTGKHRSTAGSPCSRSLFVHLA